MLINIAYKSASAILMATLSQPYPAQRVKDSLIKKEPSRPEPLKYDRPTPTHDGIRLINTATTGLWHTETRPRATFYPAVNARRDKLGRGIFVGGYGTWVLVPIPFLFQRCRIYLPVCVIRCIIPDNFVYRVICPISRRRRNFDRRYNVSGTVARAMCR